MILVDSSVWIDHFRRSDPRLVALLEAELVAIHPFIIGEIACGNLRNRIEILKLLQELPSLPKAEDEEVLFLIDQHHIHGRELGYIDVHLLAACLLHSFPLWTHDKRLHTQAKKLKLS